MYKVLRRRKAVIIRGSPLEGVVGRQHLLNALHLSRIPRSVRHLKLVSEQILFAHRSGVSSRAHSLHQFALSRRRFAFPRLGNLPSTHLLVVPERRGGALISPAAFVVVRSILPSVSRPRTRTPTTLFATLFTTLLLSSPSLPPIVVVVASVFTPSSSSPFSPFPIRARRPSITGEELPQRIFRELNVAAVCFQRQRQRRGRRRREPLTEVRVRGARRLARADFRVANHHARTAIVRRVRVAAGKHLFCFAFARERGEV